MASSQITTEAVPITDKDEQILALKDENYTPHTWQNLIELIETNQLDLLTRRPSQLKLYLVWSAEIKNQWGSVTNFILKNRLHWEPAQPEECEPGSMFKASSRIPLVDPSDYKILMNDWPYGLDAGIQHVIVWLKHKLPSTSGKGDLTPEARVLLEDFVQKKFSSKLGAHNVIWFRNWTGIQSVRSLEHFHILVKGTKERILEFLS